MAEGTGNAPDSFEPVGFQPTPGTCPIYPPIWLQKVMFDDIFCNQIGAADAIRTRITEVQAQ